MIARIAIALLLLCCCPAFAAVAGTNGTAAASSVSVNSPIDLPVASPVLAAVLPALPENAIARMPMQAATESVTMIHRHSPNQPMSMPRLADTSELGPILDAIPMAGRIHRKAGQRFNTTDGSSVDAFAICYRMNHRLGMQVIPGDPAPVKLAVSSLSNNTGLTVGMTLRLSR